MNYERLARVIAKKHGVDPNVFVRQIRQESGFNPNVVSPAGARGIAQIMPATARSWGVNPDDPRAALNAAARNMAKYVKAYGSYRDALVAYNAGPGRVGKPLYAETANYIKRILPNGEPRKRTVRSGPIRSSPARTVAGGVDPAARAAALQAYVAQRGRPGALLALASGLEDAELPAGGAVAAPQSTDRQTNGSGGPGRSAKAQGLSPLLEMFWQGPGGVNVDNGKLVRQGYVPGHTDHVHVAAGPKTLSRLDGRAADFGLRVSSADRPGAVTSSGNTSFHAVGKARDYAGSAKQMAAFAQYVARLYGVQR